jgi:chromosome segregation ATPase
MAGPADPLAPWLDHLRALLPPRHLLHLGAGVALDVQDYARWGLPGLTLVEADEAKASGLADLVEHHPGWRVLHALVAGSDGEAVFHAASNPRESGLLSPDSLRPLWRSLQERARQTVSASTPDRLIATAGIAEPDWLMVDCLPAATLLRGADRVLDRCDVVVARVALVERERLPGASLDETGEVLRLKGLRLVSVEEERMPRLARALFVRPPAERLEALAGELRAARDLAVALQAGHLAETRAFDEERRELRRQLEESDRQVAVLRAQETAWQLDRQDIAAEKDMLAASLAARTAEKDALAASLGDLEGRLAQSGSALAEAELAHDQLRLQLVEAIAERDRLRQQAAEAAQERERLRQQSAEVAQEREQLRQQLAEVAQERDQLRQHMAEAALERDQLRQQVADAALERDQLRQQVADAALERDQLRQQVADAALERDQMRQQVADAALERDQLRQQVADAALERDQLRQQVADAALEREQLRQQVAELGERSAGQARELVSSIESLEALRVRIGQLEGELSDRDRERSEMEISIHAVRSELALSQNHVQFIEGQLAAANAGLAEANARVDESAAQSQAAHAGLAQASSQIEELGRRLAEHEAQAARSADEVAALTVRLRDSRAQLEASERARRHFDIEMARAEAQIALIRDVLIRAQ